VNNVVAALRTRRSRIILPFLFAYGLALYLVAGTIGDAFSGRVEPPQSAISIERSGKVPGQPRVKASDRAKAVRAAETASEVRNLTRGKAVSVAEIGPWTASDNPANDGPEPQGEAGVAIRIDLPEAIDLDLGATQGSVAALADRSVAGARVEADVVKDVRSVVVLYDPATDKIVSVLPVPKAPPQAADGVGGPPDLPALDDAPGGQGSNSSRARGRNTAPGSPGKAGELNPAVGGAVSGG
jgi:hypothetical protein